MSNKTKVQPKHAAFTAWLMNGHGGWTQQPVILVEGRPPFFAGHPNDYIAKLEELHGDPTIERMTFWTYIGELKDSLEQHWGTEEKEDAKSHRRNGHRTGR